jgi:hypothetical protein
VARECKFVRTACAASWCSATPISVWIARHPSRDVVQEPIASVDAHTPPAWRGGRREAVRRAARMAADPRSHDMRTTRCATRACLGRRRLHSLRHISPRTQLAPSHAMPYHTSLREHRRPLGGKSGCRLPIAEPIADRRLYDCRVSCSCVIMCSCLPSSRMTRACRDECERMWGRAGTAGGMRPAARGVRATTRGESRAPSARMPCVRTSPRADPVQNRIAA